MKNEQNNNQSTKPKKTTAVYFLNIKNKKKRFDFYLKNHEFYKKCRRKIW